MTQAGKLTGVARVPDDVLLKRVAELERENEELKHRYAEVLGLAYVKALGAALVDQDFRGNDLFTV